MILEMLGLIPLAKEQIDKARMSIKYDKKIAELKTMWEIDKWDCIKQQLHDTQGSYVYWCENDVHLVQMTWQQYKYNRELAESGLSMDDFAVKYAYKEFFDKRSYVGTGIVLFDIDGNGIHYHLSKSKKYSFNEEGGKNRKYYRILVDRYINRIENGMPVTETIHYAEKDTLR